MSVSTLQPDTRPTEICQSLLKEVSDSRQGIEVQIRERRHKLSEVLDTVADRYDQRCEAGPFQADIDRLTKYHKALTGLGQLLERVSQRKTLPKKVEVESFVRFRLNGDEQMVLLVSEDDVVSAIGSINETSIWRVMTCSRIKNRGSALGNVLLDAKVGDKKEYASDFYQEGSNSPVSTVEILEIS